MTAAERIFWAEVKAKRANSRSLKLAYAVLMSMHMGQGIDKEFWPKIHDALRGRLDLSDYKKLDRFKCEAWAIYEAIAKEQAA